MSENARNNKEHMEYDHYGERLSETHYDLNKSKKTDGYSYSTCRT